MEFDNLALQDREREREEWISKVRQQILSILSLSSSYRKKCPCQIVDFKFGSFNACFLLQFEDSGPDWVVRFPVPGKTMFPDEKVRNEVTKLQS
jgi:hypothetical protein